MKIFFTSIFITALFSDLYSQNDPVLDKAYAKLKEVYNDMSNFAVPYKKNGKWGLKSSNGSITYDAKIDSIYSLKKDELSTCFFLAKENNVFKIIDCNGNQVLEKSFTHLKIPKTRDQRDIIFARDSTNSYQIQIKNNIISLLYFEIDAYGPNFYRQNIPLKTDFYFVSSPLENQFGFVISNAISNSSTLTYFNSKSNPIIHEFNFITNNCSLIEDKILRLHQQSKVVYYFFENDKFYRSEEFSTIYPINNDEYIVFKKNLIEFLNNMGKVVSDINIKYDNHTKHQYNKFTIKYTKEGKNVFKTIDVINHQIIVKELISNDLISVFEHFYVCNDNKTRRIFNNALNQIYVDTNISFQSYNPLFGPPLLMFYKNGFWSGLDTTGKLYKGGYIEQSPDLEVENGTFKVGDYSKSLIWKYNPEACGIFLNGSLQMFGVNDIQILDRNKILISTKRDKCAIIDSNKNILLKGLDLKVIKTGNNFILEARNEKGEVYLINSKLQKILTNNIYLSVFDITKRNIDSPFLLYHDNINKYMYGLIDENEKIIQPNQYRIIMAVNKNFIVVDKNYEIGYLDHNGTKLF